MWRTGGQFRRVHRRAARVRLIALAASALTLPVRPPQVDLSSASAARCSVLLSATPPPIERDNHHDQHTDRPVRTGQRAHPKPGRARWSGFSDPGAR